MRPPSRSITPVPLPRPHPLDHRVRRRPADELRELRLVHKALADVNRLRIVQRLAEAEATVTELIDQVGLSQPLVSWHLGRLRAAGLVETRRSGRETFCRLLPEAFEAFAARQRPSSGIAGAGGREQAAS